jgi:hypothetical protein
MHAKSPNYEGISSFLAGLFSAERDLYRDTMLKYLDRPKRQVVEDAEAV